VRIREGKYQRGSHRSYGRRGQRRRMGSCVTRRRARLRIARARGGWSFGRRRQQPV